MKEWDKKRDVMRHYDLTAHIYDMQYAEEQTAKIDAAIKNIKIGKHSLVLDVGCGTGLLFKHIGNKVEMLVGLDISRKILLQAKRNAEKFSNVHLIWADADNMPIKENIFNYVFAVTLIQNTPNPLKTLKEIKRTAKRNAVIIVTGLKKKFPKEILEDLLQHIGLNIVVLKSESLKCHVAICRMKHRNCDTIRF